MIVQAYLNAPHGWTKRTVRSATYRGVSFVEAMAEQGITKPSQLTDAVLNTWRKSRMAHASAATINRDEDVARKMLRWASSQTPAMCGCTPMSSRDRVRETERSGRIEIPSPDEIARLVATLDGPMNHHGMALAVTTGVATGLRLDELRHLSAADLTSDSIRVVPETGPADTAWTSKGHRERRIPVGADVLTIALEFIHWRDAYRWQLSDQWMGKLLARACKAIEIPPCGMHDFRRTFATEAVRSGIALTTVQDWMGHRDIRTTQRYLGRYRSDATVVAPAPAAAAILRAVPAQVLPMAANSNGYKLGYKTPASSGRFQSTPATGAGTLLASISSEISAEEKGFEPLVDFHPRRFSRPLREPPNSAKELKRELPGTNPGTKQPFLGTPKPPRRRR